VTEGFLQEIRLAEIIQLLWMSNKTGDLELTPIYPARRRDARMPIGHLYFRNGAIQAAVLANRTGDSAVENLFLWESGRFTFRSTPLQSMPPANITVETQSLILRGVALCDNWTINREIVPTTRIILARSPHIATFPPLDTQTPEARLLVLCDGNRQLHEIIPIMQIGGIRCRQTAATLITRGYLVPHPPSAGERLNHIMVTTIHPLLGIAAELFCDEALLLASINPENLAQTTTLSIQQVTKVIAEMEREVTTVLGPQRAKRLTENLNNALGIQPQISFGKEIHHV
jgi:hypothetical protein